MKKLFLSIVVSFLTIFNSFAEFYFPLNQEWKYMFSFAIPVVQVHEVETVTFEGEQVVDGLTYHSFFGVLLRSEGNRIYARAYEEAEEYLIYDFDAQVGDTLTTVVKYMYLYELPDVPYAIVTAVDTVTLLDGRSARRLHYTNRPDDIEFIGSTQGLLAPLHLPMPSHSYETLLCVSLVGEPILEIQPQGCTQTSYVEMSTADKWITLCDGFGSMGRPNWIEEVYTVGADTVIDSKTYRRLLSPGKRYYGAIRYSDDMSRLYYRSHSGEYLLCDFSLPVGATCSLYLSDEPSANTEQILQDIFGTFTPEWVVVSTGLTIDDRHCMTLSTTLVEHYQGEEVSSHTITTEVIQGVGTSNVVFLTHDALGLAGYAGTAPRYTLCAMEGYESLYSYDLTDLGIVNNCPDWSVLETAISQPLSASSPQKVIADGQLYILINGVRYSLIGAQLY